MIRQPAQEQQHCLSAKTLDQVFVARAREGLSCSLFEAQALTELVREVYFPWLTQTEAVQAGQLALQHARVSPAHRSNHYHGQG